MIRNKIMIHFGHPKPTANKQKLYIFRWRTAHIEEQAQVWQDVFNLGFKAEWWFLLTKVEFNLLNEAPPARFKRALKKWIQSGILEDNAMEAILLDTHYKYDKVENMAGLLDVIDKESCTFFLMDDTTRTITVVSTTHNTKDISIVWKGLNWESFLLGLLNVKAMFKVIACICDNESFKSLLTTMCKSTFVTKIWFEFGHYMENLTNVPSSSTILLSVLVLMFAYLFPCKIGTNVCAKILGNKKLSTLLECPNSFFF